MTAERIRELPLDRLKALSEDLLDFSEMSDLVNWLDRDCAERSAGGIALKEM